MKIDDGAGALLDANRCRTMRPDWAEACNRQAAAHMLLKVRFTPSFPINFVTLFTFN